MQCGLFRQVSRSSSHRPSTSGAPVWYQLPRPCCGYGSLGGATFILQVILTHGSLHREFPLAWRPGKHTGDASNDSPANQATMHKVQGYWIGVMQNCQVASKNWGLTTIEPQLSSSIPTTYAHGLYRTPHGPPTANETQYKEKKNWGRPLPLCGEEDP